MINTIRKLTFAVVAAMAMTCALTASLTLSFQGMGVLEAAQAKSSSQVPAISLGVLNRTEVLTEAKPKWRYTRFGWQDANEWATVDQIEHPPARRFDNLHPIVLAMLILFSVLASIFWASNEWELAQLMGEPDRP